MTLGWPGPEELTVALNQSVTLEWCEAHAVFINLVFPHAIDGIAFRVSEAVDELAMSLEMAVQHRPVSNEGQFHGEYPRTPFYALCTKANNTIGIE